MKIIVVGVGKLGEYLSRNLVRDGNEVTLIDVDFSDAKELINNEDVNYICGNALDSNVLKEAGAKNCDLIICVTDSDENNIICAMLARKLGTKNSIARIRNVEYTSSINLLKNDWQKLTLVAKNEFSINLDNSAIFASTILNRCLPS